MPENNNALKYKFNPVGFTSVHKTIDKIFMRNLNVACPFGQKNLTISYDHHISRLTSELRDELKTLQKTIVEEGYPPKKMVGKDNYSFNDFVWLWDWAGSYKFYQGGLPEGITEKTMGKLEYLASLNMISFFDGEGEFEKVYTSEMFATILDSMNYRIRFLKKYSNGEIQRKGSWDYNLETEGKLKYLGYSGHSSSILPILYNLKTTSIACLKKQFKALFKEKPEPSGSGDENSPNFEEEEPTCFKTPEFAANIEILLLRHKNSGHFYLQMLYNGEPLPICQDSQQPTHPCPVDTALKHLSNLMVSKDID